MQYGCGDDHNKHGVLFLGADLLRGTQNAASTHQTFAVRISGTEMGHIISPLSLGLWVINWRHAILFQAVVRFPQQNACKEKYQVLMTYCKTGGTPSNTILHFTATSVSG